MDNDQDYNDIKYTIEKTSLALNSAYLADKAIDCTKDAELEQDEAIKQDLSQQIDQFKHAAADLKNIWYNKFSVACPLDNKSEHLFETPVDAILWNEVNSTLIKANSFLHGFNKLDQTIDLINSAYEAEDSKTKTELLSLSHQTYKEADDIAIYCIKPLLEQITDIDAMLYQTLESKKVELFQAIELGKSIESELKLAGENIPAYVSDETPN